MECASWRACQPSRTIHVHLSLAPMLPPTVSFLNFFCVAVSPSHFNLRMTSLCVAHICWEEKKCECPKDDARHNKGKLWWEKDTSKVWEVLTTPRMKVKEETEELMKDVRKAPPAQCAPVMGERGSQRASTEEQPSPVKHVPAVWPSPSWSRGRQASSTRTYVGRSGRRGEHDKIEDAA